MIWLLAIVALAVTPYEVTVQTRDGETVRGSIAEWNDSVVELSSIDGSSHQISRERMSRIIFSDEASKNVETSKVVALLMDGSTFPADACSWNGSELELVGSTDGAGRKWKWELPAERIRAIRFNLDDARQEEEWRELVARERTSDWLVVYRKKQGALDYVEGVIENISSERVTILLDEEPTEVPLDRVFGIVFYHSADVSEPQKSLNVRGLHGLSLAGRDVRFGPDRVEIELSIGGKISVSPDAIKEIEFFSDAVFYLTDIEPVADSERWQPFFKLPTDSPLLGTWGLPRRNRSYSGDQLQLLVRDSSGTSVRREFDRGLAMRSRSELVYVLPSGYTTLRLLAGMDPATHLTSDAILLVELDGQSVGEWRIARSEPAQTIEVDVTGKRRLRLLVDYGSGTDSGDVVHLCEVMLLK